MNNLDVGDEIKLVSLTDEEFFAYAYGYFKTFIDHIETFTLGGIRYIKIFHNIGWFVITRNGIEDYALFKRRRNIRRITLDRNITVFIPNDNLAKYAVERYLCFLYDISEYA
jgi:hypothetical protein